MEQFKAPSQAPAKLEREPSVVKKSADRLFQQRDSSPAPMKRPRFPRSLFDGALEKDQNFIDPRAEAVLLLPEKAAFSLPVQIALDAASLKYQKNAQKEGFFGSIYEYLMAWWSTMKKRVGKRSRSRVRLTKKGEETLEQLRYLALLCDATEARTPDEILLSEGAFGEAYHEIMTLSSNLEKMAKKEEEHHVQRYKRHLSSVLQSTP
ncbi:MAG: hypothetical protein NT051_07060 [Candidatus Micrarchaeota archaeon]|nr:hypothetical protein [Candidatus Micrarchaeota archaeon]